MCEAFNNCNYCRYKDFEVCPCSFESGICHGWECICPENICKSRVGCYTDEEYVLMQEE